MYSSNSRVCCNKHRKPYIFGTSDLYFEEKIYCFTKSIMQLKTECFILFLKLVPKLIYMYM